MEFHEKGHKTSIMVHRKLERSLCTDINYRFTCYFNERTLKTICDKASSTHEDAPPLLHNSYVSWDS